jgi:hypothetical protein
MPALRGGAHDWPWGPAVAAVAVVAVAVVPVGSVCTIITHRRCLATQSIRRLGRSARPTNINPTAPRASQCSAESGASSSAAVDGQRAVQRIPQLLTRARVTWPRLCRFALRAAELREPNCGAEFKKKQHACGDQGPSERRWHGDRSTPRTLPGACMISSASSMARRWAATCS